MSIKLDYNQFLSRIVVRNNSDSSYVQEEGQNKLEGNGASKPAGSATYEKDPAPCWFSQSSLVKLVFLLRLLALLARSLRCKSSNQTRNCLQCSLNQLTDVYYTRHVPGKSDKGLLAV